MAMLIQDDGKRNAEKRFPDFNALTGQNLVQFRDGGGALFDGQAVGHPARSAIEKQGVPQRAPRMGFHIGALLAEPQKAVNITGAQIIFSPQTGQPRGDGFQ